MGVSPMCQYSAEGGVAHDWHFIHFGPRAVGGAARHFFSFQRRQRGCNLFLRAATWHIQTG
jgi:2,4-dienoyl-CoA reductase-like NADH-dependent reductase (Old Yellow Enzyme family)